MSTDVVNPAVRDAEMLTANFAVRLPLVAVAGHNPVRSRENAILTFLSDFRQIIKWLLTKETVRLSGFLKIRDFF